MKNVKMWLTLGILSLLLLPGLPSAQCQAAGSTPKSLKKSSSFKPLQGGVTKLTIMDEPSLQKLTPLMGEVKQTFLTGRAEHLYDTPPVLKGAVGREAPPALYRAWLEKAHPQFCLSASKMPKNRFVVVYGKYDDTGRTIKDLGVPFTTIQTGDLDGYDLSQTKVLVVDCPGNISPVAKLKVRRFVDNGGYLFTTDWLLDGMDEKVFPNTISWNRAMNRKKMYDATIVGEHPFLFKNTVTNAHWKMDIHCHLIHVINKEQVKVLAISRGLATHDPDGMGALAAVFPAGKGYVLHMIAHFDRSQNKGNYLPDPAPHIGISLRQAIAINFFVAGLTDTRL